MAADIKRPRGRPRKADKWDQSIFVRANREMKDAIVKYQHDKRLISESAAVRDLVTIALEKLGRL